MLTERDFLMNKTEELDNTKIQQKGENLYDIELFSIKKYFFDSSMERKIQKVLDSFISDQFIVLPHVGFREIFKWDWNGDSELTIKVTKMHFDFVIYDKRYMPVMAIEVWGKRHREDWKAKKTDRFKKELLKKCGLKLVIIDASKKIKDKEIDEKIKQQIKKQIPDCKDYPVYCPKCHSIMKLIYNDKTGKGFYGCSTYEKGKRNNCPIRGLSMVPPLYIEKEDVKEEGNK